MSKSKADIQVFNQTDSLIPLEESLYSQLLNAISEQEQCGFNFVEVVYVNEDEIVRINKEHLDHDYVTDIITFRYDDSAESKNIEGTMFCCAPRIMEQANEFEESTEREFLRIYIHGLLHLIGYNDKSDKEKEEMTSKENTYLDLAASL
jgi:rRNA maturation RNase YbeY